MSEIAIQLEQLSKKYTIGHQHDARDGLRHALEDALRSPLRWFRQRQAARAQLSEDFWALRDVSFDVKQGEVVGIIGRNGAGKSTLLKILSRITEPTSGSVRIRGRVASLLEVGTGFHQELTGRENIFLNGAILGMSKAEIKRKFDEIVAFSEVEKFLDTPVKRYSSGMYVRLAFAVAAHLEPEILIIDEVLAVGDTEFQKKCLGKMRDVSGQEGRTVLFVSHNTSAIAQLCTKAIFLQSGAVAFNGGVEPALARYLNLKRRNAVWQNDAAPSIHTSKPFSFTRIELLNAVGEPDTALDVNKPFSIKLHYSIPQELTPVELSVRILTPEARPVMTSLLSDHKPHAITQTKKGHYVAEITFPALFLMPGEYVANIASHAGLGQLYHFLEGVFTLTISDTGTNYSRYGHNHLMGVVIKQLPWTDERHESPSGY